MPIGGYTAVRSTNLKFLRVRNLTSWPFVTLDVQKIVQLFVEKSEIYLYPGLLSKWNFQDVHI